MQKETLVEIIHTMAYVSGFASVCLMVMFYILILLCGSVRLVEGNLFILISEIIMYSFGLLCWVYIIGTNWLKEIRDENRNLKRDVALLILALLLLGYLSWNCISW